jgi:hypothetical protein
MPSLSDQQKRGEILKKRGADSYAFAQCRKAGRTLPKALLFARQYQEQAARYHAEKDPVKKRLIGYPKMPGMIEYNPENEKGFRWVEKASQGLRVKTREETGWYIDSICCDVAYPSLVQIPARNGQARYFPAIADPCNDDCFLVDFSESFDDEKDAWTQANRTTESYAEECREYDSAWQAGARYAQESEELSATRKEFLKTILTYKKTESVLPEESKSQYAELVREKVKELLAAIRKNRETMEALSRGEGIGRECDFSFYTGDKKLRMAFNDGAEKMVLA